MVYYSLEKSVMTRFHQLVVWSTSTSNHYLKQYISITELNKRYTYKSILDQCRNVPKRYCSGLMAGLLSILGLLGLPTVPRGPTTLRAAPPACRGLPINARSLPPARRAINPAPCPPPALAGPTTPPSTSSV